MWISRKEFKALTARVEELETWKHAHLYGVGNAHYFTVYGPRPEDYLYRPYGHAPYPHKDIAVKGVIEHILDHLGIELVYVEGQPAKVEFAKKPKR